MNNIFDIFSSSAKIKVLRTLFFHIEPLPLRHIAAVSGLPVFSVQNATSSLLEDKMIKRTEKENYVLFELDKNAPLYCVMKQFFIIEVNNRILMEAKNYHQRAVSVLKFAAAATKMFKRAKKKGRV